MDYSSFSLVHLKFRTTMIFYDRNCSCCFVTVESIHALGIYLDIHI